MQHPVQTPLADPAGLSAIGLPAQRDLYLYEIFLFFSLFISTQGQSLGTVHELQANLEKAQKSVGLPAISRGTWEFYLVVGPVHLSQDQNSLKGEYIGIL